MTFLIFIGSPAQALVSLKTVTVLADSTMGMAIAQIARDYSRSHNVVVNTSFAQPAAQESQITEGGSADILITPKQGWIDTLKTQGLIDIYSPTPVARNALALVGPVNSPLKVSLAQGFPTAQLITQMGNEPNFVVASPDTLMEGSYAKEALHNLHAAEDMEPYTLYPKQSDQMLDMVTRRGAYGIFLYSTTISQPGLRVLDMLPESSHKPIDYYAVVVASDNMDEARKFLEYLKSPEAKKTLRDNGFAAD